MENLLHQIVEEEQKKILSLGFLEIPIPNAQSLAKCSIFTSDNWQFCQRLLIIIVCGNGIQPGIWSRSLVLEPHSLLKRYRSGSMLPYLHTALQKGYGVIVTNPSTNMALIGTEKIAIPCSSTPEMHVSHVWRAFGKRARCSQIYISAYGRGGELAKFLVETESSLRAKLAAIAFIESSHHVSNSDSMQVRELLSARAIHWQRSTAPAGTQLMENPQLGCLSLSAGQPQNKMEQKRSNTAWTIAASMETVFDFFESASAFMPDDLRENVEQFTHCGHVSPTSMSKVAAAEHLDDAEMIVHEDETSESYGRGSARSMVISTSMSVADFDLLAVVGKGAYGKVYLAQKNSGRNANRVYAMKVLRKENIFRQHQIEHAKSEQRILRAIEHPFIIRLRYAFQNEQKLYLIMDYYSGGSLFIHLRRSKRFSEDRTRFYAAELVLAIAHLHAMRIMYRDLKLENILMGSDGYIVITDFGLSKEDDQGTTFVGTPEYLAPEIIKSHRLSTSYGKTIDWWSFGVLIYEMIYGQTPFFGSNRREIFQNILTKEPDFPPELFSMALTDLLKGLLVKDPKKRLGCSEVMRGPSEIMEHAWFQSINWQALMEKQIQPPFKPEKSGGERKDLLQYVPNIYKQQEITDSPVVSGLGSLQGPIHFEDFSYIGSDILGSRRTSCFRESDFRMEEYE